MATITTLNTGDSGVVSRVTINDNFTELNTEKVDKSGDETIAGVKTFSSSPIVPTPTTDTQASTKKYVDDENLKDVHLTGDQTVAGVKTFSSSPIVPLPTTDLQAATKKYVDDTVVFGAPDASASTKGIAKLTVAPASPTEPIAVGANDYSSTTNAGITKLSKAPTSATEPIAVGSNDFASETNAGIVEEATQAEVAAGTATGGSGAKLVVTPAKLVAYSKPWTLLNSWTHSGDVASVTFNNLGGYSDLLILAQDIGSSGTNNFKIITVSEDNGSTFLGANKYTNTDTGLFNGSSITITNDGSANVGSLIIHNATSSVIKFVSGGAGDSSGYIINSTSAINAIRLSIGNGTNITAGSLYVYGK